MIPAHPLHWPEGLPRSKAREKSQFKTTLAGALDNVEGSIRRFLQDSRQKVVAPVLSSNVTLGVNRPQDPGVACWFEFDGAQVCIAVDRYLTPAENLQAIYHIVEARRTELRHGTLAMVRASFQGLKMLPSPPGSHWTDVLGVSAAATGAEVEAAYKALADKAHPDKPGGSTEAMSRLNRARDQFKKENRS